MKQTVPERFWKKVDRNGPISSHRPDLGPCWMWLAQINKETGYGCFWIERDVVGNNVNAQAHRVSYELVVGPIPKGLQLDHLCRVRKCVCPSHLEPVTSTENTQRGDLSINGWVNREKDFCLRGHPFDEKNTKVVPSKYGTKQSRQCRACTNLRMARYRAAKIAKAESEIK